MFDHSNEVFEQGLPLLVSDYCSCQVAEYVRATSLNGVQVAEGKKDNSVRER